MQALAVEAWKLAGPLARWHVGDLAWSFHSLDGRERPTRIWEDERRVVAWASIEPPASLEFQVHPKSPELVDDVLDWFEASAQSRDLVTWSLAEAANISAALESRGYRPSTAAPWFAHTLRDLDSVPEPIVPAAYALRCVRGDEDVERRVAVHRAAFDPSRFTTAHYRRVASTWPYTAALDCVVEAPDGSFAAYALAWLDEANRVGELEPVGTHPAHRRRGLARAVSLFALDRLRDAGARTALVLCRGDADDPVPKLLYESIGFRQQFRTVEYRRF